MAAAANSTKAAIQYYMDPAWEKRLQIMKQLKARGMSTTLAVVDFVIQNRCFPKEFACQCKDRLTNKHTEEVERHLKRCPTTFVMYPYPKDKDYPRYKICPDSDSD